MLIGFFQRLVAIVDACHHVKLIDRLELDSCSPGGKRITESPWSVQEKAQRDQVETDRSECFEVLRSQEFFAVNAVDRQSSQADAQNLLKERLCVRKIRQPRTGGGPGGRELDREIVPDIRCGEVGARAVRIAGMKLPARPAEELLRLEGDVENGEVVLSKAALPSAGHVAEWVKDKEEGRIDT